MQTLSEIEAATEAHAATQVEELAAWLERRRRTIADGGVSSHAARPSISSFFGRVSSGRADGASLEAIDADLARGASGSVR